ncbi:YbaB/EbfC family nucleoid-associated protein [Ructibacterium gallinarum]|uniref:Nucleoid-associated protein INF28_04060 n=1 Tax=Ructibacterium gallinarum TaxID=2779355 RepID=A0A9D5LZ70_9FIRM|nr:YbaB/EbfC family nucleoid-associated protein [Ructibacterium gallinarum]MBE5039637.1 YbaB/EbfC family nucleoid-associated protein [Ructibacterium gallinarum]
MAKSGFPRGMGGGNMNQMIKQAQKMQEQMMKMQEEIEAKTYTATAGGGAVQVVVSGKREIQEITLKPEVVDPDDIEMLQDLIVAAVNEGLRKMEADSSAQMGQLTGGLNIPGLF